MNKFIITTDTTADLPMDYIKNNEIGLLPMSFQLEGKEYSGDTNIDYKDFYEKMRNGEMPTTAMINPETARAKFKGYLDRGYDVLHISFSSGMSGSYNSCRIAALELQEEYPNNKIVVIDSLSASLGEGLIVHKAITMNKNGKSLEEVVEWIENNKLNVCHYITVDDLNHLYRGGRVSKTAAVLGTIINVKPIIHVNNEGKLIPVSKVRGRKQSLNALFNVMNELKEGFQEENDIIFISHGDCEEDAKYLASKIKDSFNIDSFLINYIGPTVGAHSGPGTVALFFMGKHR